MSACGRPAPASIPFPTSQVVDLLRRADASMKTGQYEQAIGLYDRAIQAEPDLADLYYRRGLAYFGLDQFEEAITDFSTALRLNHSRPMRIRRAAGRRTTWDDGGCPVRFYALDRTGAGRCAAYLARGKVYYERGSSIWPVLIWTGSSSWPPLRLRHTCTAPGSTSRSRITNRH